MGRSNASQHFSTLPNKAWFGGFVRETKWTPVSVRLLYVFCTFEATKKTLFCVKGTQSEGNQDAKGSFLSLSSLEIQLLLSCVPSF